MCDDRVEVDCGARLRAVRTSAVNGATRVRRMSSRSRASRSGPPGRSRHSDSNGFASGSALPRSRTRVRSRPRSSPIGGEHAPAPTGVARSSRSHGWASRPVASERADRSGDRQIAQRGRRGPLDDLLAQVTRDYTWGVPLADAMARVREDDDCAASRRSRPPDWSGHASSVAARCRCCRISQ